MCSFLFKKYGWLAVLSVLLVVVLLVLLRVEPKSVINRLRFTEGVCGIELKLFHDEKENIYYLFLPAYVDKGQVEISKPDGFEVDFSKDGMQYGERLAALPLRESVTMTVSRPHGTKENFTLRIMQGKNIPTIYVETGEGGVESVRLAKGKKTQAAVVVVDADGTIEFTGMSSLTGRGNSTFKAAKPPLNLNFQQAVSLTQSVDSAMQWCLLANYGDDSQIRNAICYHIAHVVGIPYTSHLQFVTLYINGEYYGLYNLATKQNYVADLGTKLTAVFERTRIDRPYNKISRAGFYFRTRYGDTDVICNVIDTFETVLYNDTTTYEQLEQYADMQSIVQKYFMDAFCGNYDVKLSQYYTLNDKGKISSINAWDYDHSFGLCPQYPDYAPNQISISFPWYNALIERTAFRDKLLDILRRDSAMLQREVIHCSDSVCLLIEDDWQSNSIRWKNFATLWNNQKPLRYKGTDINSLQRHKDYIQTYMKNRILFLDDYWNNPEQFVKLEFDDESTKTLQNTITLLYRRGDTLTERMFPDGMFSLPDAGFKGWYTKDGVSVTDVGIVTQDMAFEEKCEISNNRVSSVLHKLSSMRLLLMAFSLLMLVLFIKTVIIPIKEAWQ